MSLLTNDPDLLVSMLDSIETGICVMDRAGQLTTANSGLYKMLGFDRHHQSLNNFYELIHTDDVESVRELKKGLLGGDTDNNSCLIRLLHGDGQYVWVSVRFNQKIEPVDAQDLFIVQIEDITRIKTLEAQSQRSNATDAISILAGGITHSFNNILSSILGNAEFALRHELKEDEPGTYSVQQIVKAAHRANFLTRQILTLSRRNNQEPASINLNPIIKEVTKFLKATIPANISIRLSLQASSDIILADPVSLHQLLMNLCTIAINAMQGDGGTLGIMLMNSDSAPSRTTSGNSSGKSALDYIELSIIASANRLPENETASENEFENTDGLPEDSGTQTLAAAKRIADELNAVLTVATEKGKGSCYSVFFPVNANLKEETEIPDKSISGGKERILFVDDDEQIVEFIERSLGILGYDVVGKESSIEALEAFSASPEAFDMIISDMNMDNLTGDQLAEKMLAIKPDVPVIICTGYDEMLTRARAKEIGVKGVIMKPFLMDEIDELIRRIFDK